LWLEREGGQKTYFSTFNIIELQDTFYRLPSLERVRGLKERAPKDFDKSNIPYVRAAKFSNMNMGTNFKEGSVVKYLWVKSYPGHPKQDIVAFEYENKLPKELQVDWEHMRR
jgi:hypothetical protein